MPTMSSPSAPRMSALVAVALLGGLWGVACSWRSNARCPSVYRATSSTLTLPAMPWLGREGRACRASHCCPQAGSHCRLHATSLLMLLGLAGVP